MAGSRKGIPNKRSAQLDEVARRLKCDPFELLLLFAKGDWKALGYENECYFAEKADGSVKMGYVISPETRMYAAKEAIKYLHAQKKAVEHSTGEEGITVRVVDYTGKK